MPGHLSAAEAPQDLWTCHECGWTYPNHHPSAKHRRNHKRICGSVSGFASKTSTKQAAVDPTNVLPHGNANDNAYPKDDTTYMTRSNLESLRLIDRTLCDQTNHRALQSTTSPEHPHHVRRRSAHALEGVWVCRHCGWTYPNAHPSAKLRRKHKRRCPALIVIPQQVVGAGGSSDDASSDEENKPTDATLLADSGLDNNMSIMPSKPSVLEAFLGRSESKRELRELQDTIIILSPKPMSRRNSFKSPRHRRDGSSGFLSPGTVKITRTHSNRQSQELVLGCGRKSESLSDQENEDPVILRLPSLRISSAEADPTLDNATGENYSRYTTDESDSCNSDGDDPSSPDSVLHPLHFLTVPVTYTNIRVLDRRAYAYEDTAEQPAPQTGSEVFTVDSTTDTRSELLRDLNHAVEMTPERFANNNQEDLLRIGISPHISEGDLIQERTSSHESNVDHAVKTVASATVSNVACFAVVPQSKDISSGDSSQVPLQVRSKPTEVSEASHLSNQDLQACEYNQDIRVANESPSKTELQPEGRKVFNELQSLVDVSVDDCAENPCLDVLSSHHPEVESAVSVKNNVFAAADNLESDKPEITSLQDFSTSGSHESSGGGSSTLDLEINKELEAINFVTNLDYETSRKRSEALNTGPVTETSTKDKVVLARKSVHRSEVEAMKLKNDNESVSETNNKQAASVADIDSLCSLSPGPRQVAHCRDVHSQFPLKGSLHKEPCGEGDKDSEDSGRSSNQCRPHVNYLTQNSAFSVAEDSAAACQLEQEKSGVSSVCDESMVGFAFASGEKLTKCARAESDKRPTGEGKVLLCVDINLRDKVTTEGGRCCEDGLNLNVEKISNAEVAQESKLDPALTGDQRTSAQYFSCDNGAAIINKSASLSGTQPGLNCVIAYTTPGRPDGRFGELKEKFNRLERDSSLKDQQKVDPSQHVSGKRKLLTSQASGDNAPVVKNRRHEPEPVADTRRQIQRKPVRTSSRGRRTSAIPCDRPQDLQDKHVKAEGLVKERIETYERLIENFKTNSFCAVSDTSSPQLKFPTAQLFSSQESGHSKTDYDGREAKTFKGTSPVREHTQAQLNSRCLSSETMVPNAVDVRGDKLQQGTKSDAQDNDMVPLAQESSPRILGKESSRFRAREDSAVQRIKMVLLGLGREAELCEQKNIV